MHSRQRGEHVQSLEPEESVGRLCSGSRVHPHGWSIGARLGCSNQGSGKSKGRDQKGDSCVLFSPRCPFPALHDPTGVLSSPQSCLAASRLGVVFLALRPCCSHCLASWPCTHSGKV